MDTFHLYRDIKARNGGEIYIGVEGTVRTGKSTFVIRFIEQLVLQHILRRQRLWRNSLKKITVRQWFR